MQRLSTFHRIFLFFLMIRPPPRSTLFPTRRSSDLAGRIWTVRSQRVLRLKCKRAAGSRRKDFSDRQRRDRKSTRLNSSHSQISYAVFCLKKKKKHKKCKPYFYKLHAHISQAIRTYV